MNINSVKTALIPIQKGGGNLRRRAATAILNDFELSERLRYLGKKRIKNKGINQILMKLTKSLSKSIEPDKLKVDVNNIAKVEEGFKNPIESKLAEEQRLNKALKQTPQKGFESYNKFFDYVFENLKKSNVKNLERLAEDAQETAINYADEPKKNLFKMLLSSSCLKDYMPLGISKYLHS